MGYNTTVVVMNDSLDAIERDPEFGKNLSKAISQLRFGRSVDVPALGHCNAATAVETHHADNTTLIAVGGNYATLLATSWGYSHHKTEDAERLLRAWADKLGFVLHKKPTKGTN